MEIFGADWWEAASAFGTVFATFVAVGLAAWEIRRARKAERDLIDERETNAAAARRETAALVSSWVEVDYVLDQSRTHYIRTCTAVVANESNEPVFDVHIVIGIGDPAFGTVQVGPLSIPAPIHVLPPRRQRSWDVSSGLNAFETGIGTIPGEPVARIDFSDARQIHWNRDFNGLLTESVAPQGSTEEQDPNKGIAQVGDIDNWMNPMGTAIRFLNLIWSDDPPCQPRDLKPLLAENAPSWGTVDAATIQEMKREIDDYGLAAHVWYRTFHVAYVRLRPNDPEQHHVTSTGYYAYNFMYLTLVFYAGRGWFVFSMGAQVTQPSAILFPPGALSMDPRQAEETKLRRK